MSLPALAARMLPTSAPTGACTAVAMIDSLINAFSAAAYVDGTTRAGAAQAWTWTKFTDGNTVGAWGQAPTLPGRNNFRVIIVIPEAGSNLPANFKRIPVYQEPWAADRMWIGIAKSGGSYTSWSDVNPFGTGQFSGYWPFATAGVSSNGVYNGSYWRVIETPETTWLAMVPNSGSAAYGTCFGALVDPETGDAVDAESDGRVYGLWTSVSYTMPAGLWGGDNSEGDLFDNIQGTGYQHFGTFLPGTDTFCTAIRATNFPQYTMTTRTGKLPRINVFAMNQLNGGIGRDGWAGRIREVSVAKNATLGQALLNGATTVGYTFAHHPTVVGQPALLQY